MENSFDNLTLIENISPNITVVDKITTERNWFLLATFAFAVTSVLLFLKYKYREPNEKEIAN